MASEVERAIEAIIMVTEEPIPPHLLAQILEVTPARVEELCAQLAETYVAEDRGFELVRVAGGYRFQSHPDLSGYVERFALEGQSNRLSAAALETLALVAYKQPVSRAQVAEVRGVSVDSVMRTLQHRGYVAEVARDTGPGQAVLYGTTTRFLERLGIDSVDQLPPLAQFVPGPEVMDALDAGMRHGGARSLPAPSPESEPDSDDGPDDEDPLDLSPPDLDDEAPPGSELVDLEAPEVAPDSETPEPEPTDWEAQEWETPAPETPDPKTPDPETPAPEFPEPESPEPESPEPESPELESPELESPALESPAPESPALESPALESPAPETHEPETHELESPAPESTEPESPEPETHEPESPDLESPDLGS